MPFHSIKRPATTTSTSAGIVGQLSLMKSTQSCKESDNHPALKYRAAGINDVKEDHSRPYHQLQVTTKSEKQPLGDAGNDVAHW